MSLSTTRGIILHQVRYAESSLIVTIYTEAFGLGSYMIKGVRKSKPTVSPALLQALTLVELVVNRRENTHLHYVKEVRSSFPYTHLSSDIKKSSIGFFINELLYRSIKEEEANPSLFGFVQTSLELLDLTRESVANFHLWFALQLTRYLGFMPSEGQERHLYFDLKDGVFLHQKPDHIHVTALPFSRWIMEWSRPGFRDFNVPVVTLTERRELLGIILEYYRLHIQSFGVMKSPAILEEVLR